MRPSSSPEEDVSPTAVFGTATPGELSEHTLQIVLCSLVKKPNGCNDEKDAAMSWWLAEPPPHVITNVHGQQPEEHHVCSFS